MDTVSIKKTFSNILQSETWQTTSPKLLNLFSKIKHLLNSFFFISHLVEKERRGIGKFDLFLHLSHCGFIWLKVLIMYNKY